MRSSDIKRVLEDMDMPRFLEVLNRELSQYSAENWDSEVQVKKIACKAIIGE